MNFTRLVRYLPYNIRSGRRHDPASTLPKKLAAEAMARGYTSEAWGTLADIQQLSGQVRAGEVCVKHGVMVKWYNAEHLEAFAGATNVSRAASSGRLKGEPSVPTWARQAAVAPASAVAEVMRVGRVSGQPSTPVRPA